MDRDGQGQVSRRGIVVLVATLIALLIGVTWYQGRQAEREREEQLAQAQGIARVLSATFSKQNRLQVGEVRGALDVTSVDAGLFKALRSSQRATLPYSVQYTMDLSGLSLESFRWDANSRTLMVQAPDVVPGEPNIDESRRSISTSGLFVTRRASENLGRRGAALATQAAARKARSPAEMQKARENGREALQRLIELPLQAANIGEVDVVVRYPQESSRVGEQWDVSPSIAEVLRQAEQSRGTK